VSPDDDRADDDLPDDSPDCGCGVCTGRIPTAQWIDAQSHPLELDIKLQALRLIRQIEAYLSNL
jgi:hypothetical protein